VGDLLCIGSCSGRFFALDRRLGTVRWSQDVRPSARPTSFHGDALVVGDSLIVIGTDAGTQENRRNHVWAFATTNGAIRWKHPLDDGIVSDVVRAGGRAFAITRADSLLCLDLASGRRLWCFADSNPSEPQFIYRSPAVAQGRVFLGDGKGNVRALDVESGRVLWTRPVGSAISTGVLAIDDELVLADAGGALHRIDQATGAIRTGGSLGGTFYGPPTSVGDSLVLFAGDDAIKCWDPRTARVRWTRDLPLSSSRPYVWHGAVWAATVQGELFAFRPSDGKQLWFRTFEGSIRGIGQDERTLYLGTQQGMIYAYRPSMPDHD
jgi:outer membrane protein assembly factor BamB